MNPTSDRLARRKRHRKVVASGLAASLVLHGVALSALSRTQPSPTPASVADGSPRPLPPAPPIQVVRIEEPTPPVADVEPVVLKPVLPVRAAEAGPRTPEGAKDGSLGGAPSARASLAPADVVDLGRAARVALSMRPQFATQRRVPGALRPIERLDAHADREDEGGEDEGESFWRRLGVPIGRGGGQICKPRPLAPLG